MKKYFRMILPIILVTIMCLQQMSFSAWSAESELLTSKVIGNNFTNLDLNTLPLEWDGEYDGYHKSTIVKRDIEIHIQSISKDGAIEGKAIIAPSEKADTAYGANGSYLFRGNINSKTGKINLMGYKWVDYPANYDSFGFMQFDGYFDLQALKPAIHGTSENGVWEMTAIDYDSINHKSGFVLGRDNNNYRNLNENSEDCGFKGQKKLALDDDYFERLTRYSPEGEKNRIKKAMNSPWPGACYGITSTIGLVYEGYLKTTDIADKSGKNTYFSLGCPYKDKKFLNTVNYFQLSQNLKNGGRESAIISYSFNRNILAQLTDLEQGGDSLSAFLKKLVSYVQDGHIELLGLTKLASKSGHAVLVTGCSYNTKKNSYELQIYDVNSYRKNHLGEFSYMTVAKDFSSFSYKDANREKITDFNYANIFFLDWKGMRNIIKNYNDNSDQTNYTEITFPVDQSITITNENEEYLTYDGNSFSGNMKVHSIETTYSDEHSEYVIETPRADTLVISNTGNNVDVEVGDNVNYMAVEGSGIDKVVMDMDNGLSLNGTNYQFKAYVTTDPISNDEKGLLALSARADSDVSIVADGTGTKIESGGKLSDVSTGAFVGTDSTEKRYVDTGKNFIVKDDATIRGATQVDGNGVTEKKFDTIFKDVQNGSIYYYTPVYWGVSKGIVAGTSKTTFSPNNQVTRAQFVTFLYRLAGSPRASTTENFTDISGQIGEFQNAINWAAKEGIAKGKSSLRFSPNDTVTREEAIVFLYRYMNKPTERSNVKFIDVKNGAWYTEAISWGNATGVVAGYGKKFGLGDPTTRGQAITFIYRMSS